MIYAGQAPKLAQGPALDARFVLALENEWSGASSSG